MIVKGKDLNPGDVVKMLPTTNDPWQEMIVEKIENKNNYKQVTFFRPFVRCEKTFNVAVTPLIGIERFSIILHDGHDYLLVKRYHE
jgi:hypothetical protein